MDETLTSNQINLPYVASLILLNDSDSDSTSDCDTIEISEERQRNENYLGLL